MMNEYNALTHKTVLTQEVIQYLVTTNLQHADQERFYLDVTFGGGGHTRALLEADQHAFVTALEWDTEAIDTYAQELYREYTGRFRIIHGNFAHLYKIAKKEKLPLCTGILADFGPSQLQIGGKSGFSFAIDTPLDMRMSPQQYKTTARDIINGEEPEYLRQLFWQLGEERNARAIVDEIIKARAVKPIETTMQLVQVVTKAVGGRSSRSGHLHPATKVFQALRMVVNHELDNINSFLPAAINLLRPGGRLGCISFHSLEDRLVKNYFNDKAMTGAITVVTKKAVVASPEEQNTNHSSRSAKLRVCERTNL